MSQPAPNPPCPTTQRERQPYAPPRMTVHGDVRQITATRDPATGSINGGSAVDL